ncbi:MAG: hypothetical protein CVU13_04270 [Bacteroidetes bacterium HGW-Bacteroidetes-8]|nr:MAG: hypothetical protein CVU13_04270 [Bacteroidetes bacterium HGW-Bacteroidetes-8]
MKKFVTILLISFSMLQSGFLIAKPAKRAVAIVVDMITYDNCKSSIDGFAGSIMTDGLVPIVVLDKWGVPDSLRAHLYKLYADKNLEGAIFIGNIPIPMIRNGQHLSTAFKMDQRRAWEDSSIPSDRFYDDFDLKFEYIKRDSVHTLFHYYNLSDNSPHRINCDIYSARIKPPVVPGKNSFELINEYLDKAVREKSVKRGITDLSYFAGHGYNSNCMVSRADERVTLIEQFNIFREGKGKLNYIDFTFDDYVKYRLMAELSREDLDLAVLHHHGSEDAQLLNGSPITNSANIWLELTKKFFRGKIRGSDDTTASKKYYVENYSVPESWVENAFNPEVMRKDSLDDASMDITIPDMYGYKSNVPVILIDACFNGSFHLNDYISGHYIFNDGKTVVVKANSVNTLQDTWTNQLIGLMDLGVSVGNWAKGQMTLESHLIGDPTFRYASSRADLNWLDEAMVLNKSDEKLWRKAMKDSNPELKSLAMKMLYFSGKISTEELLSIQRSESRPTVRLQAFYLINKKDNPNLVASLRAGLYDNYELIRRLAAKDASTNLSPELIDDIFNVRFAPGTSKRVEFQLKGGCEAYSKSDALEAFKNHVESKDDQWYKNRAKERKSMLYTLERTEKEYTDLLNPAVAAKSKRFSITALRNSNSIAYLDILFKFLKTSEDAELKVYLAEAFGWYTNSSKRDEIVAFCKEQAQVEKSEAVKKELLRTVYRLTY